MRLALPAVLALCSLPSAVAEPRLVVPSGDKALQLGLAVTIDGEGPEKANEAFLDRFFDFFDRDGNGSLSPAEAAHVFPLPMPGAGPIVMDFARLDADGDGQGSRTEFKQFYRRAGFASVTAVFAPASAARRKAGAELFRRLDRDGDGRLSREELARAPDLLRTLDADEDEVLTIEEVLAGANAADAERGDDRPIRWETAAKSAELDGVLAVNLGKPAPRLVLRQVKTKAFAEKAGAAYRIDYMGGTLALEPLNAGPAARFGATREFYLTPFKSALGGATALKREQIEDDPALAFLASAFASADCDGDGRLTLKELEALLDLVEAGLRAQVVVTVHDQGKNLFLLLDENQDGRLDLHELNDAVRLIDPKVGFLSREAVPRQTVLQVEQGAGGKTFGPILLSGAAPTTAKPKAKSARGPKWFQAMDRNGDGYVSPREFLGPPEAFAALDLDHDGLISVEEAEREK
jgi:Ca2+-binding EF-hand superfamily protein